MKTTTRNLLKALCLVILFIFGSANKSIALTTWVGGTSSAWATSSNWSPATVPDGSTVDVTIPSGTTYAPLITSDISVRDITIASGVTVTSNTGGVKYFRIYGNVICDGTIDILGQQVIFYGINKTISGTGQFTSSAGGGSPIDYFYFTTSSIYSLASNFNIDKFYQVSTATFSLSSYTLIVLDIFYQPGTFNQNTGTLQLEYGNAMVYMTDATFNEGTGTTYFAIGSNTPAAAQWLTGPFTLYDVKIRLNNTFVCHIGNNNGNITCHNLIVDCPGCTTFSGWAHQDNDLVINGDLTINAWGDLDGYEESGPTSKNITLGGNWTNNGRYVQRKGTVTFNGTGDQTIGGSTNTTFFNLIENKASGRVIQGTAATVGTDLPQPAKAGYTAFATATTGVLTLTAGEFFLNQKTLTIANPASAGVVRTSGYVVSETNAATNTSILEWDMAAANGTYIVPFGVSGTYIPFTFAKTAGSSNMQFATRATTSNDNTPLATGVSSMGSNTPYYADASIPSAIDRWWEITALSGSTSVTANLTFTYRGSENSTTLAPTGTFAAQHWNGSDWDPQVGSGSGVIAGTGTVTVTGANTFSPWILSSSSAPLPIELLTFNAQLNMTNVDVSWATASETNNDYFTLEKSRDAQNFEKVFIVDGAGNSSSTIEYFDIDHQPYIGISYYRLKQTDFNGKISCSNIVPVEYNPNGDPGISLFPNPSDAGTTTYLCLNQFEGQEVLVVLRDIAGREIFSKVVISSSNNELIAIEQQGAIAKGSYLVTATSANKIYNKKLIVK